MVIFSLMHYVLLVAKFDFIISFILFLPMTNIFLHYSKYCPSSNFIKALRQLTEYLLLTKIKHILHKYLVT